jgi:hypothetical protein
MLAVVLIAGVAVTGWLYATGRFGIGPLSAADKKAADVIAQDVEGPQWADTDQKRCATERLLHDTRSGDLEKQGVIDKDGDGWKYVGTWPADTATTYLEAVLECTDDWGNELGDTLAVDDPSCLEQIDRSTLAAYLAADTLDLADSSATDQARDDTVAALDDCYATDPPAPQGKAKPGYRSVRFTFDRPDVSDAEVTLAVRGTSGERHQLHGTSYRLDTGSGGRKGCVVAQTVAHYAWGTTRTARQRLCGTSEPERIWWTTSNDPQCSDPACWDLHYEGFADDAPITFTLHQNGGSCMSVSGECSHTVHAAYGGRGVLVTWSAFAGWHDNFTATVGNLTAVLPN